MEYIAKTKTLVSCTFTPFSYMLEAGFVLMFVGWLNDS